MAVAGRHAGFFAHHHATSDPGPFPQRCATGQRNLALIFNSGGAFENVIGGALTNTLTGNALNNILTGGANSDTLRGLAVTTR